MNIRHFAQNSLTTALYDTSRHQAKIGRFVMEVYGQGFSDINPDDLRIYIDHCDKNRVFGELIIYNYHDYMKPQYTLTIEYLPLNRKKGWKGDKPWKVSGNIRPPHKWYLSASAQSSTLKEALEIMITAIVKESNPDEN